MSFGFPAYSTGSQKFDLGLQELLDVISRALGNLGWSYETPLPNQFLARVSLGMWSWGEKMGVDVTYDGTVTAKSECVLVTQCLDWGKNSRNVNAFFNEVARLASAHPPAKLSITAYDENEMTPVERVIKEDNDKASAEGRANSSCNASGD